MKRILITGATGNIGKEIIPFLDFKGNKFIAGVRSPEKAKSTFESAQSLDFREFDFENPDTFRQALEGIDRVFLLRPPHISDVKKHFNPLIFKIKEAGIREIVFLSVQGADKSRVIPHNKIEKRIQQEGLDYIFLRPSYFMQNLITTLYPEIKDHHRVYIPAGNARFNWIDTRDIGRAAAQVMMNFDSFKNTAYDITGEENLNFNEVVKRINSKLNTQLEYKSPALLPFFIHQKRKGYNTGFILVQILLHYLPRYGKAPAISNSLKEITGITPKSLEDFLEDEKKSFIS